MDYTVARYQKINLENLAHTLTIEKLIRRGYPQEILELKYDPKFVIRGLTVDKQLGNILKLDRHGHVGRAYHGRTLLSKTERKRHYRGVRLRYEQPRFALVDTYFELPEICLFANLIEFQENQKAHLLKADPWQIFDDIRECIDEVHRDNSLKTIIKNNLSFYIQTDEDLPRTLHKFRSAGKKLFLLTNSFGEYTNEVMTYLLDEKLSDYPSWKNYFDVISVGACKPAFFTEAEPIARLNSAFEPILRGVKRFKKGEMYQGGNSRDFEKLLRCSGEEILYIGDHIFGDILRSKRSAAWRTALIVEELESELQKSLERHQDIENLHYLEAQRRRLDDASNFHRQELNLYQKAMKSNPALSKARLNELKQIRSQTNSQLKTVIKKLELLASSIDCTFNPYWGMVFKQEQENSKFGEQVTRHACLYTSRVSNFLEYSNYQYFRSPRDLLPHETGQRRGQEAIDQKKKT